MLKRAKRLTDYVTKAVSLGAELCVCGLVVLVSYSAISRYVFDQPVHFTHEVGGLLLMAIAFLSFAYVFSRGRHIQVTLVTSALPQAVRNWVEVVASLVSLIFLIIFIKLSYDFAYLSYKLDCHSVDARLYEVPWMALMPAGTILLAIAVLMFAIDKAYSIAKVEEKREMEESEHIE